MGGLKLINLAIMFFPRTKPPRNMGGLKPVRTRFNWATCTKPPRNMGGLKQRRRIESIVYVQNPLEIWGV